MVLLANQGFLHVQWLVVSDPFDANCRRTEAILGIRWWEKMRILEKNPKNLGFWWEFKEIWYKMKMIKIDLCLGTGWFLSQWIQVKRFSDQLGLWYPDNLSSTLEKSMTRNLGVYNKSQYFMKDFKILNLIENFVYKSYEYKVAMY